jgi:serine/threonine protein kinase
MLVGEAPFAGDCEVDIYEAIISDDVDFPYSMSVAAIAFVKALLQKSPVKRLGAGPNDALDVRRHGFFRRMEWVKLLNRQLVPPFVPALASSRDTSNFDDQFTRIKPALSPADDSLAATDKFFTGFSFNWLGGSGTEV